MISHDAALTDAALLALHRNMVATPSVSGSESTLCTALLGFLGARGIDGTRHGDNLFVVRGPVGAPVICLNSHLDTVPPSPGWTRAPHEPVVEAGRVYGLGSNDAKAAGAAMVGAFLRLLPDLNRLGVRVLLALTAQEEVGGKGAEALVPELERRGLAPAAVIVGEPTGLDVAIAQKGLLVLELCAQGQACHAANARAMGAQNALRALARDLLALDAVDFGPPHPSLGPVTVEPTIAKGGTARNMVPSGATCLVDVRTNPSPDQQETYERLRAVVTGGELRLVSDRLHPYEIDPAHPLVAAARAARPQAALYGSRGLSDLLFFRAPGIKVGPGRTERSHTADEFVFESEILDGARFYEDVVRVYASAERGSAEREK